MPAKKKRGRPKKDNEAVMIYLPRLELARLHALSGHMKEGLRESGKKSEEGSISHIMLTAWRFYWFGENGEMKRLPLEERMEVERSISSEAVST